MSKRFIADKIVGNEIVNQYSTLNFVVEKCKLNCKTDLEINSVIQSAYINLAFRNSAFGYKNPKDTPVYSYIDNSK